MKRGNEWSQEWNMVEDIIMPLDQHWVGLLVVSWLRRYLYGFRVGVACILQQDLVGLKNRANGSKESKMSDRIRAIVRLHF